MNLYAYHLVGSKQGLNSLNKNIDLIDKISPTLVELKENGELVTKNYFSKNDFINDKEIFPLIQNRSLSTEVTKKFLSNKKNINCGIDSIMKFLENCDYKGINIDIEGVKKESKENFNYFMQKLKIKMKKNNYFLDISIPAKTENHSDVGWAAAYDYNFLGNLADNVCIMTYDYHWAGGSPGAIAPIDWLYNVIDYVIMEIKADKIYVGLAAYGYDWIVSPQAKRAKALSYSEINKLIQSYNLKSEWDQESETPYLKYKDKNNLHELWYENKFSLKKKIELIKRFQVKGVCLWRLGLEDQGFWQILN
ncbi:MAG: glycosyl hydrolase family 18 protein [Bacillota bacterium]